MKTASVRDLRYHFPKVERMLAAGEEIQITKRKRVVAVLAQPKPARRAKRPPMPDFLGRMKKIFGDKVLKVTGAEIVSEGRGDY